MMPSGEAKSSAVAIAISGCGAVTKSYAVPALQRLAARGLVRIAALYDPDRQRAEAIGRQLRDVHIATSYADMLGSGNDMVLLAGPPRFRWDQGHAAISAGLSIFCEKPLAATASDARKLIEASRDAGVKLGVGLVRRQFPATRMIHWLTSGGALGDIQNVDWFEGGVFAWPVASADYFSQSYGGVLADIGTHVIDLARWWFGPLTLLDYEDDAMGGVEANCRIRIGAGPATVDVRLSRDWARPNRVVITGTRGNIVWNVEDLTELVVEFDGTAQRAGLAAEQLRGTIDFVECYAKQIEEFVNALSDISTPSITAEAGLEAAALVDLCKFRRRLMKMGWFSEEEWRCAERFAGTTE